MDVDFEELEPEVPARGIVESEQAFEPRYALHLTNERASETPSTSAAASQAAADDEKVRCLPVSP